MNYWDQIRDYLQGRVSAEGYENWLKGATFLGMEGRTLLVAVPDRETRSWIETEYGTLVHTGIQQMNLPVARVVFEAQPERAGRTLAAAVGDNGHDVETPASLLNPKFTFDSFVVGACNQFAHAAAHSVATNPSRRYNPLFLYGGVGMGKTHLMHAIGHELLRKFGGMRIVYTSSERFTNEVVNSVRNNRMPSLHQKYRSADVLLVDDIQLLGNKERTQ